MKHLPRLYCVVLPHKQQRYDTVGNYYQDIFGTNFIVSKMDSDAEFLVLIHELVEWYLTQKRGIKIKDIDRFDMKFKGEGEPGDDKDSPYRKEHRFATRIEKILAKELGVNWDKYDKMVSNL